MSEGRLHGAGSGNFALAPLSHSLALLVYRAVDEAGNGLPLGFLPLPSSIASLPHLLLGGWNKTSGMRRALLGAMPGVRNEPLWPVGVGPGRLEGRTCSFSFLRLWWPHIGEGREFL